MIQRIFFISFISITFHSWKESPCNLLTQEHWILFFFCILTFFRPPYLKSEHKVSFFIFRLEGHRKVFCILSSSLIISVGTFDINEWKIIFEFFPKVLKTMILPSSVRRCICQIFKTFWILVMLSRIFIHFAFSCCTKSGFW